MKIHKALTLKQLLSKGFMGIFDRSLCNPLLQSHYSAYSWHTNSNYITAIKTSSKWSNVTCRRCLKLKEQYETL